MKNTLEKIAYGAIVALMIPLFVLNTVGGIVAGAMLLFGGDWGPLILGIIFLFIGTFIISLLLLPLALFSWIAIFFYNRKNTVGFAFSVFVSQSYLYAIIFGVSYSVFATLLQFDGEANRFALIIWSFAIASAPWTFMASKEKDNQSTQTTLLVTQVGLLVAVIFLLTGTSLDSIFDLIKSLVIIPILISTWFAIRLLKNRGDTLLTGDSDVMIGKYTQKEVIFFVLSLLETANADGHLDPTETKKARAIFKELTSEGVSKSLIEKVYLAMNNGSIDFDEELNDIVDELDRDFKIIIVRGAYLISKADGKFDSKERDTIERLGKKLYLSESIVSKIINE